MPKIGKVDRRAPSLYRQTHQCGHIASLARHESAFGAYHARLRGTVCACGRAMVLAHRNVAEYAGKPGIEAAAEEKILLAACDVVSPQTYALGKTHIAFYKRISP